MFMALFKAVVKAFQNLSISVSIGIIVLSEKKLSESYEIIYYERSLTIWHLFFNSNYFTFLMVLILMVNVIIRWSLDLRTGPTFTSLTVSSVVEKIKSNISCSRLGAWMCWWKSLSYKFVYKSSLRAQQVTPSFHWYGKVPQLLPHNWNLFLISIHLTRGR